MAFNIDTCFRTTHCSEDDNDVVIFAHRHWVAFLAHILIGFFLLVVPIVVIILSYRFLPGIFQGRFLNFVVILGSVYYLIMLTFIFSAWISYYYDIYVLTRESIVDINQTGFFNRKISQLPLSSIENVSSNTKGFLQTLFNFGNVVVETAGARVENFLMKDLPNCQYFADKVMELHDELIEKEARIALIPTRKSLLTRPNPAHFKEGEIKKNDLDQGGEVKL